MMPAMKHSLVLQVHDEIVIQNAHVLTYEQVRIKSKLNDNFYIAHISIPRMLTALGVYI
jgi:hypothetical protein